MANDLLPSAEEIQRQMQSVRSSLRADVKELVENARDMTDWHYYVRRFPVTSVALAAVAGFTLTSLGTQSTPRTSQSGSSSTLGEQPTLPLAAAPSLTSRMFSNLSGMATSALSRAAIAFATQHLNRVIAENGFMSANTRSFEAPQEVHPDVQPNR